MPETMEEELVLELPSREKRIITHLAFKCKVPRVALSQCLRTNTSLMVCILREGEHARGRVVPPGCSETQAGLVSSTVCTLIIWGSSFLRALQVIPTFYYNV